MTDTHNSANSGTPLVRRMNEVINDERTEAGIVMVTRVTSDLKDRL